ncbi:uncharacterized protein ACNS7B_010997 isoform 1-T1 [Menidia menidia]
MFTQGQTFLERAFLPAVTMLLVLTTARSASPAALSGSLRTTTAPPASNLSLTTQITTTANMEDPLVKRLHTPCATEYSAYCGNGGTCMIPQDSNKPSCICAPSHGGPRCLDFSEVTYSLPEMEEVIAITFGVIMVILILAVVISCCAYKRCVKSAPLIKSSSSETSV